MPFLVSTGGLTKILRRIVRRSIDKTEVFEVVETQRQSLMYNFRHLRLLD